MSASCLYAGTVRHRRFSPRRTEFRHSLALLHLDLDELPQLMGGLLVRRRPGFVRFRRRDYLRPLALPLADAVRGAVAAQTGVRPTGPVTILAHPRTFGRCFNPVSFYYCWTPDRRRLLAVLAEVTNTPWGERHAYVLPGGGEADGGERHGSELLCHRFDKALHVSPFMPMDQRYSARLTPPAQTLSVHIESRDGAGELQFDATLGLRRRELTRQSLRAALVGHPLRVLALIYGHAAGLRLSGLRTHPRPARSAG